MGATTFFLLKKEKREKAEKEIDYKEKVKQYHTGGGWYELPDVEKNMRKDEAIAALKESDQ